MTLPGHSWPIPRGKWQRWRTDLGASAFQAEEFRTAIHQLLEWLSEAEQSLRFRGALPDDTEALQSLMDVHKVGGAPMDAGWPRAEQRGHE